MCVQTHCFLLILQCVSCWTDLGRGAESGAQVRVRHGQLFCNTCYSRVRGKQEPTCHYKTRFNSAVALNNHTLKSFENTSLQTSLYWWMKLHCEWCWVLIKTKCYKQLKTTASEWCRITCPHIYYIILYCYIIFSAVKISTLTQAINFLPV